MGSWLSSPLRETTTTDEATLRHIDLPDDWRGDIERPRERLCPICMWDGIWDHLLVVSGAREFSFQSRFTTSMLSSSASRGNLCCAVLLAFLQKAGGGDYDQFELGEANPRGPMVSFDSLEPPFECDVWEWDERDLKVFEFWKLLIVGPMPAPPGMMGCRPDGLPSVDTGSETSVAWAKKCIHECRHNHSECQPRFGSPAREPYIPSRLLYIPPCPTEGVALRLKESVPSNVSYVALSHCWGNEDKWPCCITTKANYASQLKNIPWDVLSQTFRDAAIFARKLELEYIWIDSMCIIQGDEKDWQREATQMSSIYSNAYVTFAALHARDSHEGLFCQPGSRWLIPILTLGYRGQQYQVQTFNVPDDRMDFETQVDGHKRSMFRRTYKLLDRAWTFQERIVSPRVLFFGREELLWECPTGRAFEEDAYLGPPDLKRPETWMHAYTNIANTSGAMTHQWQRFVESYNLLELSEPTDRLPAIAAIAQKFAHRNPDDEYLCGLWRNSIYRGLTLQFNVHKTGPHIGFGPPSVEQPKYIAPSWCWASAPGVITQLEQVVSHLAEIVNVSLRYVDNSRFGRIAPGSSITLRGLVLDCSWDVQYELPSPAGGSLWKTQSLSITCMNEHLSTRFFVDYDDYSGLGQAREIEVCMLLIGIQEGGTCVALVLRRTSEGGAYVRVGLSEMIYLFPRHGIQTESLTRAFLEEASVRECVIE